MQNSYVDLMMRFLTAAITICIATALASAETLKGSYYCMHTKAAVYMRVDFDHLRLTLKSITSELNPNKPIYWERSRVERDAKLVGQTEEWYFYQTKLDNGYQYTYAVKNFLAEEVYVNTVSVNPEINPKKSGISTEIYYCQPAPFD